MSDQNNDTFPSSVIPEEKRDAVIIIGVAFFMVGIILIMIFLCIEKQRERNQVLFGANDNHLKTPPQYQKQSIVHENGKVFAKPFVIVDENKES